MDLAGGRPKNKSGKKASTLKIDGVAVNASLWGILERLDGTLVPPAVYSALQDLIYLILDELYADGKLDSRLVPKSLTTENWRYIRPKFDADFPEVHYCSAHWKLRHFFQIWMPSWKSTRKLGMKRKSESMLPGERF